VHWQRLRPKLMAIAAGESRTLLAGDVYPLMALNEQHIAREDAELLPMTARLLSETTLECVGRAMRKRRDVPPVPPIAKAVQRLGQP
jgi:hemerythrin-like domain-containing protein